MKALAKAAAILSIAGSGITAATAADMAVKALPPAPAPAVYSWSGFYVGGGIGTRSSVIDSSVTSGTIGTPAVPINLPAVCASQFGVAGCGNGASLDNTAFRGSIYAGWNWQVSPMWVLGVEGDVGFADRARSLNRSPYPGIVAVAGGVPALVLGGTAADSFTVKTTWDASARVRAGYVVNPSVMLYVTGGAAWLHLENTSSCDTLGAAGAGTETCTPGGGLFGAGPAIISHSTDRFGWTVGGGAEFRLTGNWIGRAEYRYADYGTVNYSDTRASTFGAAFNPLVVSYSTKVQTHTATFGISYLFNGGPVVAKY
jgi:outer membrane immunogenic protein